MAKTKLLADIQAHAKKADDYLTRLEHYLGEYLQYDHPLTPQLKELFQNADAEMTAMGASIHLMEQHVQAWDGKSKLKNLLKSKAKLKQARDNSIRNLNALKTDHTNLKALFAKVNALYIQLAVTAKSQALNS